MLFSLNRKVETQKVHTNSKTISVTIINQLVFKDLAGNKKLNGEKLFLWIALSSKTLFFMYSVIKIMPTGVNTDMILLLMNGIVKKCAVGEYPKSRIGRSQAA